MIYIGTSGYSYPRWRGLFYPEGLPQSQWLNFYAEHFSTIEINATFYRMFTAKSFEKWSKATSEHFQFSLKGPKVITHLKKLKGVVDELEEFFASAMTLGPKLGVVLWQFPPSFVCNFQTQELLHQFLVMLPSQCRHAFEFRHASWAESEIFDLLNEHKVGWVVSDSTTFVEAAQVTGGFAYIRLHGPEQLYASSYSEDQLRMWATKIQEYHKQGDVYCYFNNTMLGAALTNSATLQSFL